MSTPEQGFTLSSEAQRLVDLACQEASHQRVLVGSNHLLFAMCVSESIALEYLREQQVDLARVVEHLDLRTEELPEVLEQVWLASRSLSPPEAVLTSLHLLAGLLRYHARSVAVQTLRKAGMDTTLLRNTLISQLTRRTEALRSFAEAPWEQARSQSAPPAVASVPGAAHRPGVIHHNGEGPGSSPSTPAWPTRRDASPERREPWQEPARLDWPGHNPRHDPRHPLNSPNPYLPRDQAPPQVPQSYQSPPQWNGWQPTAPPRTPQAPPRRPTPTRPTTPATPPAQPRGRTAPPSARPTTPRKPAPRPAEPKVEPDKAAEKPLAERLKGRFGSRKPKRDKKKPPQPSLQDLARDLFSKEEIPLDQMRQQVEEDIKRLGPNLGHEPPPSPELPEASAEAGGTAPKAGRSPGAVGPSARRRRNDGELTVRRARSPQRRNPQEQRLLEDRYALDPDQFPTLSQLGRNLSLMAIQGRIDALVGRDSEIASLTDILNKRRSNNPLLIGPPGVGKTAIVEGLAVELVNHQEESGGLADRVIIELEMGRLLSGTQLRGSFSERLIGIKDEVASAGGRIVIFLDELHTWIGAGASGDGGADAAGELKAALARGRFPCIGATTVEEYTRYIESDPAFRRRFQTVEVSEPSAEDCVAILHGILEEYADHHGVDFEAEALEAAVRLSQRYMPEQRLPDKAIGLLDLAGSRARRTQRERVDREVVAEVVSDQTGVPLDKLLMRDRDRFLRMEEMLGAGLIGHKGIIKRVCEVIRRNYAGFHSGRPIGSFLFLGPTGVGKTELVKVLADFLFRDRNAIVRLDMSEYRESHAVARLIGAPPGYVGHEAGGQLTEAVRRKPYQIVLLDEVEKAHPEVLNILLQLLDDGRLTDGKGRTVNFSNTVVIMTSNLGSEFLAAGLSAVPRPRIGFGVEATPAASVAAVAAAAAAAPMSLTEDVVQSVVGVARGALSPELWNRIEERLVFGPLSRQEVSSIARLQFRDSARRLAAEREIYMEASEAVYGHLIDHGGYDAQLGARPMRQTLQRLIEAPISNMILTGDANPGDHILIGVAEGQLSFDVSDS